MRPVPRRRPLFATAPAQRIRQLFIRLTFATLPAHGCPTCTRSGIRGRAVWRGTSGDARPARPRCSGAAARGLPAERDTRGGVLRTDACDRRHQRHRGGSPVSGRVGDVPSLVPMQCSRGAVPRGRTSLHQRREDRLGSPGRHLAETGGAAPVSHVTDQEPDRPRRVPLVPQCPRGGTRVADSRRTED